MTIRQIISVMPLTKNSKTFFYKEKKKEREETLKKIEVVDFSLCDMYKFFFLSTDGIESIVLVLSFVSCGDLFISSLFFCVDEFVVRTYIFYIV